MPAVTRSTRILVAATALLAVPATAQTQQQNNSIRTSAATAREVAGRTDAQLVQSALSAAPPNVAAGAAVAVPDGNGAMRELRAGSNGFVCFPDAPNTPGPDPMCLDEAAQQWAQSWMAHEPRPKNTRPGLMYMLAGGSDISATDPFATTTEHYIASPPHWMVLWPFDAKASGLPITPKTTGTWIMWAGTPYAHLMINQVP